MGANNQSPNQPGLITDMIAEVLRLVECLRDGQYTTEKQKQDAAVMLLTLLDRANSNIQEKSNGSDELVGYFYLDDDVWKQATDSQLKTAHTPLYRKKQCEEGDTLLEVNANQSQRKAWVSLTPGEIDAIREKCQHDLGFQRNKFARDIEAALRDRNSFGAEYSDAKGNSGASQNPPAPTQVIRTCSTCRHSDSWGMADCVMPGSCGESHSHWEPLNGPSK